MTGPAAPDMDHETIADARCPRCERPLPPDAPEGLCAACLLLAGTESLTRTSTGNALTVSVQRGTAAEAATREARLLPGQPWGPYRIERLIGRGGMGEVYEAEQLESGRRVALKVLQHRLQTADARARFLLEGQLAASVSHPHTVYIYGSEEIDGIPAIAMELAPGGTLKDRVATEGPLPPAQAVSLVLDILGGLDAAHAAGILHRDIKPSNCFIDRDGTVKVGDFGLSISTLARDVQHDLAQEGFQGTPQFAPPEQLRGEPLDVRADIYAVGATLYYLLTGRAPFEAADLRTIFARVTSDAPESPRRIRPDIPAGLAAIVLQCLAKSPAERPASHAAVAESLRPFAVQHDRPARRSLRVIAATIDGALLAVPAMAWVMVAVDPVSGAAESGAMIGAWTWLASFAYYLVLESLWGASLGKRLLGLRVVSANGSRAGTVQIVRRVVVYFLPNVVTSLLILTGALAATATFDAVREPAMLAIGLAFFSTARRRNGWAALHDLASDTRVVSRGASPATRVREPGVSTPAARPALAHSAPRYGPFAVVSDTGSTEDGRLLIAFDPVLRREVWIHVVAPATPPVSPTRRDISRMGRLRWLTGRRTASEGWDAYEAPDGQPLLASGDRSPAWPMLKSWLLELANELVASVRDGSLPLVALDRLWVRRDGRIVLLDFRAPDIDVERSSGTEGAALTPVALLSALAARTLPARNSRVEPPDVPLSARHLFERWTGTAAPTLDEALAALVTVGASHERVRPWRRALPIALAAAPVVLSLIAALLLLPPLFGFMANPQTREILETLSALTAPTPPAGSRLGDPEIRTAVERHLVGRHGATIRDDAFWNQGVLQGPLAELRPLATEILDRHPSVSAEELTQLSATLAPELERRAARQVPTGLAGMIEMGGIIISTLSAAALGMALFCGLLSSVAGPGGLVLRQLGHAVVTRDGQEIGRLRSLVRSLVAWSPGIVWLIYLAASPTIQGFVPGPPAPLLGVSLALGALVIGALWTIARPARGPHDRLVGTWVVPR